MITDQRWDVVSDAVTNRLRELGWDSRKRTAVDLLDVNEHLVGALIGTQAPRGEPSDVKLQHASERLGWAPDGIKRLLDGDWTGAETVNVDPPAAYLTERSRAGTSADGLSLEFRVASLERTVQLLLREIERLEGPPTNERE